MTIYQVTDDVLHDIWPAIEPYVERAQEHDPFKSAADVLKILEAGFGQLFIATNDGDVLGFGVLEVVQYPSLRVANIMALGGRRGFLAVAVKEMAEAMIEYGKTRGATVIALSGRPGWLRVLRGRNAKQQRYVTMWADIDERRRRSNSVEQTVGSGTTVPH